MPPRQDELIRYKRQIALEDWGPEAQERLAASRVFIAGAGGLGCPAAMALTCAGVGHLCICDSDVVELSNLNRQFLHTEANLGRDKTLSALEALGARNSTIHLSAISTAIDEANVDDLVGPADLILDCLDNFPARYALNRCAIRKHIPLVHAAIWGMEGRVAFLAPPTTPCFACLVPTAPPREREIPILGAVAAAVGNMQAIEAIEFLRRGRPSLRGRMLIMDFSTMLFQSLELRHRTACPVCGID